MSYDFDTENVYMVEFNSGKNIHVKFYELQDVMDYCSLKYPKEVIKLVYEEVYSNDEEPIVNRVEINSYSDRELFDYRHGGAFDRGSADSYYGRNINPHYYVGGTYDSGMIEKSQMTNKEIEDYLAGYEWNEKFGDKKEWV